MTEAPSTPQAAPQTPAPAAPASPAPAARPAWLPEKFASPEQMAVAYGELERRMGSGSQPQQQQQPVAPPQDPAKPAEAAPQQPETPPETSLQEARDGLQRAGLSFDKYAQEVVTHGSLTEESYAELARAGYTREMVDRFYEGQAALAAQREDQLYSLISTDGTPQDGKQVFQEMKAWASETLTPAQKAAFNEAVARGDDMAALAIQGLYAQYRAASPATPNLIQGRSAAAQPADAYQSKAQMTADMRNPLYKTDPAFREKVAAKIARSSI